VAISDLMLKCRREIATSACGLLAMTAFLSRAGPDLRFRVLRALRGESKNQSILIQQQKGPQSRPVSVEPGPLPVRTFHEAALLH
jgi:hypothetical protein